MIPVVLSGGVGSRLWPLSRGMYPKQLLPLVDDGVSMLQQTVLRAQGIDSVNAPIIVCNEEHRFMVGEQLNQVGVDQARIILEPEGRNTAPAIALAAFAAAIDDPGEVLLVMPADHVVLDGAAFKQAVEKAMLIAAKGDLVTFGIVPSSPETGYGYIRSGESRQDGAFTVADFKEKPDQATAQRYLDEGG